MNEADTGFVGEGVFESFPNLYADNQQVAELSMWPPAALQHKLGEYATFLARDDIMPRARAQAERFMTHLNFELKYLAGEYEQ